MAAPPPDLDRFEEAIRAFRRRVPMTDAQFAALTEAERAYAFKVAGLTQARQVQEVFDAIDRAIEHGTTLEDFRAEAGQTLAEAWGGDAAPRSERLFRTEVLRSYSEGREEIFSDPAVREAFPYTRFDAVGDNRSDECEICEPLDGTILRADDPFWATRQLPLHPNCRCQKTALDEDSAREEGVDTRPPKSEPPPDGFGRGQDPDPDMDAFDPAIRSILRERLK